MAKLEGNPMGGFRGKLGNLVGYSWKGVWCVRSRPAVMRNPRTEAQQRHRAMFAEEVRLAGRMNWALNIGLAAVADELHMTPCNAFVKANQQAFGVEGDNTLLVDWERLIISAGPVAPIQLGVPEISDEGVLTVAFEKNPYLLRANNFDQVHLYVYCPGIGQGYLAAPVYRKERRISVSLPDAMQGQELHLYAFVTDEQGRASDTSYAPLATDTELSPISTPEGLNPESCETAVGFDLNNPLLVESTNARFYCPDAINSHHRRYKGRQP